jgi:hypothetical protein
VLRRIFAPKREEVVGVQRRLHNEELRNLFASQNTTNEIKQRTVIWAGHAESMGDMKNA